MEVVRVVIKQVRRRFSFPREEDEDINGITNRQKSHFHNFWKIKKTSKIFGTTRTNNTQTSFVHTLFRSTTRQVNDPCIPDEWSSHFTDCLRLSI